MQKHTNTKKCLLLDWKNITEEGRQCPPTWDGFTCWGPTPAGTTASSKCPYFKGSDTTKFSYRKCNSLGEWSNEGNMSSSVGWTNYSTCLSPEIRDILKRLGSSEEAQSKLNIAANTRVLEFVGLSLSFVTLLLSLFIFNHFRILRNSRTRLHRHLFIAMLVQVGIRLIVYTDQAVTRTIETLPKGIINSSVDLASLKSETSSLSEERIVMQSTSGIDYTPILCEASYTCLEYAKTAMFMWMFAEGLFLHNMIAVSVFSEALSPQIYPLIGWILPIPLTLTWALVTHFHYGNATCWWGYNLTMYYWILEGPRLAVLLINLGFLLNIVRVLITKLRTSTSSDVQQAMKAVKAALVLLPLLGLTNIPNMLDAPLEKSPFRFALWSYTTHLLTSTQGLVLSILYCFKNEEVQNAVREFIRVRISRSSRSFMINRKSVQIPMPVILRSFVNEAEDNSQAENLLDTQSESGPLEVQLADCSSLNAPSSKHGNNIKDCIFTSKPVKCTSEYFRLSPVDFASGETSLADRTLSNGFLMPQLLSDSYHTQKEIRPKTDCTAHSSVVQITVNSMNDYETAEFQNKHDYSALSTSEVLLPQVSRLDVSVAPITTSSSWSCGIASTSL